MALRRVAISVALILGAMTVTASQAGASHIPAVFNCGAAGTFTSEGTSLPTGEQAPQGFVALFEDTTKVLVALEVHANGQLLFTTPGIHKNAVDEVTCTTTSGGVNFTVIGILT